MICFLPLLTLIMSSMVVLLSSFLTKSKASCQSEELHNVPQKTSADMQRVLPLRATVCFHSKLNVHTDEELKYANQFLLKYDFDF